MTELNTEPFAEALSDTLMELETRIAYLEHRLKLEGIKDLPDGIPDDEAEAGQYFALDVMPLHAALWQLAGPDAFTPGAVGSWGQAWGAKVRVDAMSDWDS